jgi:glycosyltransferase involved in cell wall biosynthesis
MRIESDPMEPGGPSQKIRLGILVSHPIQYFTPVYRELANAHDIDLTVLFRTRVGVDEYYDKGFGAAIRWDIPLLEGYSHKFLSRKRTLSGTELTIVQEVLQQRFNVLLVHGYNSLTNVLAILTAKLTGTRVLIRGDTRKMDHHRESGGRRALKSALFKIVDGFVTIGTLNRDYYVNHGVEVRRLFFAPFCVSNSAFRLDGASHAAARERVRGELGLGEDEVVVLFVAKLTAQKRVDDLIRAFALIERQFANARLVISGSGEEAQQLRKLAADLSLERLVFAGFYNQSKLPALYAACDLFVLPSVQESWGLAVNEAMAAGLPVVVSDEVGAAPDLVEGKGTGIVFPCGDVNALAQSLASLVASLDLRKSLGAAASRLIDDWDVSVCAKDICTAVRAVAARG